MRAQLLQVLIFCMASWKAEVYRLNMPNMPNMFVTNRTFEAKRAKGLKSSAVLIRTLATLED